MKLISALALCIAIPTSGFAMSGAELLQSDREFASGYVFGVTEMRIGLVNENDPSRERIHKCVIESRANSKTLLEVSREYLKRHPQDLSIPAFGVVMNALVDMCPP
ncbi:Rap1a/Tai family immunity protein [Rhizobium sp. MC63]|uniref:Rap1a/Tai family immunity protein n=1 Tax=Rhizobium mulingense TaxID=3031128 RepID=A0ACC6MUI7_9HYPH|nr:MULTISPECIES: Rap1a/Tai family immunity protein [unclassified Rhizobium]MDF0695608.1 Rap1a/Tai family immunity protein [Rhizobium sp. MC63]MEA3517029.1 Rap1a/Tai family immunity protein [Rhizobium sp. MJ31]